MVFITIIESLLLLYFGYVVAYTFIFSIAGLFYKVPSLTEAPTTYSRFAVFIPCYKEDAVILSVARKALQQTYSKDLYSIIVIADSLQPATLRRLRQLPIEVIEVTFDVSTKVKSLIAALQQQQQQHYDYAVILDADNVMYPDFLEQMNAAHQLGHDAIQGQRLPKNKGNDLSFLDGLSEAINNHVYRQGTVVLDFSSSISGSGISIRFEAFKDILTNMTAVGGFDRELELLLIQRGIRVYYLKTAAVLDEKVQQSHVFDNQRKRWIYSQYHYLLKYLKPGILSFFKGDFIYFNSAILRNIQLPRLVNIGFLGVLALALFFLRKYLAFGYDNWLMLSVMMGLSLAMSIPREYYTRELLRALLKIPRIFVRMFLLLFKLKGANKKFIHTPHYNVEVNIENHNK